MTTENKVFTLLSTMPKVKGTYSPHENIPQIVQYYNFTKGGVDSLDQMIGGNSAKRMTGRWPMYFFQRDRHNRTE